MSFLRRKEILKRYPVTGDDIAEYLRDNNLPSNKRMIKKATKALRQAQIRQEVGSKYSFARTVAPWQVIYGEARVPGVFTYVAVRSGHTYLDLAITISCHEINAVTKLFFDKDEVLFEAIPGWNTGFKGPKGVIRADADHVRCVPSLGTADQVVNYMLNAHHTDWDDTHRQRGCAHVGLALVWDPIVFPDGLPEITFQVQGSKVLDSRTSTTTYSSNAALCIADFLTNVRHGFGESWDKIDTTSLDSAGNTCDELITLADGSTEARYTINGYFDTNEDKQNILESMCASMAGTVASIGGKWVFLPGKYVASSMEFTDDDWIEPLVIRPRLERADSFNGVKGTFIDPANSWEEKEFPAVTNAAYLAQDSNVRLWEDIQLPFVTSSATAQRLAKIILELSRQMITVEGTAGLWALQVQVGDTITITRSRYGWTSKLFTVTELELVEIESSEGAPAWGVRIIAREIASTCWDWVNGAETTRDAAPDSDLPDPFTVEVPTGIVLSSGTGVLDRRLDGTVFSRLLVTWTAATSAFISSGGGVEIQYKKSADSSWLDGPTVAGDQVMAYILDVQDGVAYDVRLRFVNSIQVKGAYTTLTNYVILGKTEKPSDVTGFSCTFETYGVRLRWDAVADLDVSEYEIRLGATWSTASVIDVIDGTSYLWAIQEAGTYTLLIKAIDTTGNYSTTETTLTVSIQSPARPTNGTAVLDGANLVLGWDVAALGNFPVRGYEVSYGSTFAGSTLIGTLKGTRLSFGLDFIGLRSFWIVAKDEKGNVSDPLQIDYTITAPGKVATLTSEVIDNNVLLRWTAPATGNLPIDHYAVYKGDTFATATLLGEQRGTFAVYFEVLSDDYVYWLQAVDIAGNAGAEKAVTAKVNQPPDFVLLSDQVLEVEDLDTLVNCTISNGKAITPVADQTWDQYWDMHGWNSDAEADAAGYPYYFEPTALYGSLGHTIDYGAIIQSSLVNFSYLEEALIGSVVVVPYLAYSADGVTWTEEQVTKLYASEFRYIRFRLEIGSSPQGGGAAIGTLGITYAGSSAVPFTGKDASMLSSFRVRLDVKEQTDQGMAQTDATGKATVTFNKTFIDVDSITVTPAGTTDITSAYDFVDAPNPTSFDVYLFEGGSPKANTWFSWKVRGV